MKKTIILLSIIFIFALFIRTYLLEQMPSGFHRDEVISGYVGRFILQTGHDIYGNFLPLLYVDKYGDYPPAIPMYFSGLSTYFFGLNVFATRFPVALIGALIIFPVFFLAKELFRNNRIALFSAMIIAILPWHFVMSRATSEGIIALTAASVGLLYIFKFINKQKPRFLLISILLFALTYFLYPSYRILVPLVFLPIPFLFKLKKRSYIWALASIILLISLTLIISSTNWGKGRFEQTSMFGTQSGEIIKQRAQILAEEEGINRVGEVKLYHNKLILYAREFLKQYITYFSPQYLFTSGGLPYRYTVSDEGLLYLIMIPLLLLLLFTFRDMDKKIGIYLLYLLLISPMPSPLTLDDVPNVHRTLFMIIPLSLLVSFSLIRIIDNVKNLKIRYGIMLIVFGVFMLEFIYFLHMYYHHANAVKSVERGDTNKEIISYIIENKNKYNRIYMPAHDAFPIYYLYFTKNFDPSISGKFRKNLQIDKIDKITFTQSYCPSSEIIKTTRLEGNIMIVDREECIIDSSRFQLIKVFTRHDGTTSYRISAIKKI